jgi:SAM-dependent methyltransferase
MAFAMGALAGMISPSITTDNYDWSQLRPDALIVDVGGGQGYACRALASVYPQFKFIVQDLPATVELGVANCPKEYRDRIRFQVHDFFTPQLVKDADVYFFRAIIHDWSDKYAVAILQSLIPALRPGARVIIHDPHTPSPKALGWWQDRQARASNLRMKLMFNSHDREEGEWEGLFRRADPRFRVNSIRVHLRDMENPVGQEMVVVEAMWEA